MAKAKLELDRKTDPELITFATAHSEAMAGNSNFPTPSPTAPDFSAGLVAFQDALAAADRAREAAKEATVLKEEARAAFEVLFTTRGNYLDDASGGSEPKILSAAVPVQAAPSPVGQLPAPEDFMPTMGDMPGEIDLVWSPVRGARSYTLEYREQGTTGAWEHTIVTKSKHSVDGLTSGKTYVFHVAAIGAAGQSPWSLEAARMAP